VGNLPCDPAGEFPYMSLRRLEGLDRILLSGLIPTINQKSGPIEVYFDGGLNVEFSTRFLISNFFIF
jgi:hypothetical protein